MQLENWITFVINIRSARFNLAFHRFLQTDAKKSSYFHDHFPRQKGTVCLAKWANSSNYMTVGPLALPGYEKPAKKFALENCLMSLQLFLHQILPFFLSFTLHLIHHISLHHHHHHHLRYQSTFDTRETDRILCSHLVMDPLQPKTAFNRALVSFQLSQICLLILQV